jgi:hypothetical protein
LYRGVLQNLLQRRLGLLRALLLLCTAAFLVYHHGALPLAMLPVIEVTSMSLLLGLVYAGTGSLLFVAAVHAFYDGIWFFGPYLSPPLPDDCRPLFLVGALAPIVVWAESCAGLQLALALTRALCRTHRTASPEFRTRARAARVFARVRRRIRSGCRSHPRCGGTARRSSVDCAPSQRLRRARSPENPHRARARHT